LGGFFYLQFIDVLKVFFLDWDIFFEAEFVFEPNFQDVYCVLKFFYFQNYGNFGLGDY